MMDTERRILLGRVLGAFGVRGELKLQSFTDPPARLRLLAAGGAGAYRFVRVSLRQEHRHEVERTRLVA